MTSKVVLLSGESIGGIAKILEKEGLELNLFDFILNKPV